MKPHNDGRDIVLAALIPLALYMLNLPLNYCLGITWIELVFALLWYYVAQKKHWSMVTLYNHVVDECGCCEDYNFAPELAITFLQYYGWVFEHNRGWYHPDKYPSHRLTWRMAYLEEFDRNTKDDK